VTWTAHSGPPRPMSAGRIVPSPWLSFLMPHRNGAAGRPCRPAAGAAGNPPRGRHPRRHLRPAPQPRPAHAGGGRVRKGATRPSNFWGVPWVDLGLPIALLGGGRPTHPRSGIIAGRGKGKRKPKWGESGVGGSGRQTVATAKLFAICVMCNKRNYYIGWEMVMGAGTFA